MKRINNTIKTALLLLLATFSVAVHAQTLYWVGGNGSWNDAGNWSATENGIGGAGVPRIQNDVVIAPQANSVLTINGVAWCAGLHVYGSLARVRVEGDSGSEINVAGGWSAMGDVQWLHSGTVNLIKQHGGEILDLRGTPINATVSCDASGSWSMQSDLVLTDRDLRLNHGTLITNGNKLEARALIQQRRSSGRLLANNGIVKLNEMPDDVVIRNSIDHDNALLIVADVQVPWGPVLNGDDRDISVCATGPGQTPFTINATVTSNYNGFGVRCRGNCNATVTVSVTGGIGSFTYSWLGGPQTQTWTAACGGPQIVIVTDQGQGVSCAVQVTVSEPPPLGVIFFGQGTPPTCANFCNGTRTALAVGGVQPPAYNWNNGAGTGPSFSQLCAGTNTLQVTDLNNCTFDTVFVFNLQPIIPNLTSTDVTCFGNCDGTAQVAPVGGTGQLTFNWGPGTITGQGTNSVSGLCPGNYNVTLTDLNGCDTTQVFTIGQPAPIVPALVTFPASCFGLCDGAATVSPGGAAGDYSFLWSPGGQTSSTAIGLCAQAYSVLITDTQSGCDTTIVFTIDSPTFIDAQATIEDASCAGECDGSIVLTTTGGSGVFSYLWALPLVNTSSSAINLCAGTYAVTVSDNSGCDTTLTFIVNEPLPLDPILTTTDVSCNGICDGTASASVSGGAGGFIYLWTPNVTGQGTPNAMDLCAGPHSLLITDMNGCDTLINFIINEPFPLTAVPSQTDITCGTACIGAAGVVLSGGTTDYEYLWTPNVNGQGTANATDLCAGVYSVLITDDNGCELVVPFTILDAVPITLSLQVTPVSCPGDCDGTAGVIAAGGAGGFVYDWQPDPTGTLPGQGTANVTGLCAIAYSVTITDMAGCDTTIAFTVPAPDPINVTSVVSDISCSGDCDGSIILTTTGGDGTFTYVWTPPITPSTGSATDLCAGSYSVTVSSGGCDTTLVFEIDEPVAIDATLTTTDIACAGVCSGSASATASGGTGILTYTWAPDPINGQGTDTATDLCAGNYTLTIADAAGCDTVIAFTILDAQPLVTSLDIVQTDCGGVCNGSATAVVPGTIGNVTYLWEPGTITGQGTDMATGLCAGPYTLTVTSPNGCDTTVQFIIGTPSGIDAIPAVTDVSCGNVCDGAISVPATGGTGMLTYVWAPTPINGQGTPNVTDLCVGSYTLVITDAAACNTTLLIDVGGVDPIDPNLTLSHETCYNGPCDGTITVMPTGGTGIYEYLWTPNVTGQGTSEATGLCPGDYSVTISDVGGGCDTTVTTTILPIPILSFDVEVTAGSCANECGGEAHIDPLSGNAPFHYQWIPAPTIGSDTTDTGMGLCAGTYIVNISEAAGCDTAITIIITTAPPIIPDLTITPETCASPCSGSATVAPTGGQGTIIADWQPDANIGGQGTYTATGLCAGTTYTVTLTDSTGCDTTITFNVDPFTDILANISSTPTLCSDTCNGTATAGPTGGTPPYTFSWSPEPGGGQGTPMATGLCPGSYDLLITDSVGCPHTESVLILGPDPIVDNAVVTPISCGGECDGTITLNATGGDGTYQYSWSPNVIGQGTGAAIDLCAGTYNVTVTDGNGCDSTFTYVLIEPPVLVISTSSTSSQCSLCVGTATVQISEGTLGFVIAWTDALGNNVGSTATLIDLCAGIYTVLVTDTNGCSTQSTVPVSDEDSEVLTTASGVTSCTNSCDGIVSVSYVCSAPLCTVLWTDALGNDLNQPTDQATGLCPGIYYVQVTNGNGCVSIDTAFVTPPTGLIANISSVPVSCSGECNGEATVGVSGVSGPFTFTWSPEPPPINGQGTPSVTGLCAGTYSILITYGAGCDTTVSVLILEPLPLALAPVVTDVSCNGDCDGTIAPTAQGGDGSYTYFWTPVPPNGQGVPIATGLCAGDHILTVTDGNGCSITDTITVNEPQLLEVTATSTISSCPACDGTASALVVGGTPPFNFSWMLNGTEIGTDQNAVDLCGGLYNLTVTDSSGCTAQLLVPVQNANAETLTMINGFTSCANDCDGIVSVDYICSAPICTTVWYNAAGDSIANTLTVSGLCHGDYFVEVTNANGCIAIDTAQVLPSTTLTINITNTPPSCPGDCDATATVGAMGGVPPYTFVWNDPNNQTTPQAIDLCAGTYAVLITDSTGCDTTVTVLIQDPLPITISGVATDILCNGVCDGTITTLVSGGTGTLTYAWSPDPGNGQGTNIASQLCADSYTLTLTDANGCTATQTWTINEPPAIVLSATSIQSECGICNGSAEVDVIGGTPGYTYLWTLGAAIYGTDSILGGVCAGLYSVLVTDDNGCQAALLVPVTDIDGEVITASGDTTTCANTCDGTVNVDFVCSDPSCTIAWFDGAGNDLLQNTNTVSGLCAGMYLVQVTNATGCITLDTAFVTAPPDLVPNLSTTQVSCFGECDGSATIAPTGGSGEYDYVWNPPPVGQGTPQATQLCVGSISVTVTDTVTGCSTLFSALILGPDLLTANIIATNPSCNGVCDGTISIDPQGGTPGYSYSWSDPLLPDTSSLNSLCAGTYDVTITDLNGCDTTITITLIDPPFLQAQLDLINNTCAGNCIGSAMATISGGVPPYTLSWTDQNGTLIDQDTVMIGSLCAGTYQLIIIDSGGCQLLLPFGITEGSAIDPALVFTNETCVGPCDGAATLSATGGTGTLTYLWEPGVITGQGTNTVTGLCAQAYTVTVTDSLGCDTIVAFTVLPYAPIDPNVVQQDILCNGSCDGSIVLAPTGGSGVYTYAWTVPNGPIPNEATALCPGVISVTIDDGTVCDTTLIFSISEPSAVTIIIDTVVDASCLTATDGLINSTIGGGTGQTVIAWQGPNNFTSTSEDIANLAPGSYTVTVTDDNLCTATATVTVNALSPVQADAGPDVIQCTGTITLLDGSGSTGATSYLWTDDQNIEVGTSAVIDVGVLAPGSHTFTLTAIDGPCTSTDQVTITVIQLPIADAGPDQFIFLSGTVTLGGSPTGPNGSSYIWVPDSVLSSNGASNPEAEPNVTSWFTVTVTGPNGCVAVDSVLVTVLPDVVFPSGFTPNGDGYNEYWQIDFVDKFPQMEVEIYNRWGEMLFESVGYGTPWDGRYNGGYVPVGTYYYVIKLNDPLFPDAYTGPLTVIR